MQTVRKESFSISPGMLWIGLALGLAYWLAESILHILLLQESGASSILPQDLHELVKRLSFGVLALGFVSFAHLHFNERRASARTLREIGARCHALFDMSPHPVLVFDKTGEIVDCNPAALHFFGCTRDYLKEHGIGGFLSDGCRNDFRPPGGYSEPFLLESSASGERKVLLFRTVAGEVMRHPLFFGIGSDVTEIQMARAAMKQQCKMALLGELAAGVAHEIINPVNGIINYAQVLGNGCGNPRRTREIACRITQESERVAAIAGNLLSFGHLEKQAKAVVRIVDVLKEALALLDYPLQKSGIRLHVETPPDLPAICGVASELQQVFINILTNARDALDTKYPTDDQEQKRIEITAGTLPDENGEKIRIAFLDNGTGIPKPILNRVTLPFFTTKPPGRGTGLGLSISLGIVSAHGGRIGIESMEGKYTKFMIDLPAVPDKESP